MNIIEFQKLDIADQEEIIDAGAKFIQTQVIGRHLCDFYKYDDFYVVFYYLANINSIVHMKCLQDVNGIKPFITELSQNST